MDIFKRARGQKKLLYKHQWDALIYAEKWFEANQGTYRDPCLLVLPTGTGKSGLISILPIVFSSSKALILTPASVITKQIAQDFGHSDKSDPFKNAFLVKRGVLEKSALASSPFTVIKKEEAKYSWNSVQESDITVTNAHQFSKTNNTKKWQTNFPFTNIDLLLVDEAHHFPTSFWNEVVERCRNTGCKIIFLTATPYRTDGAKVFEAQNHPDKLPPYFHFTLQEAWDKNIIRKWNPIGISDSITLRYSSFTFNPMDPMQSTSIKEADPNYQKKNRRGLSYCW